MAYNTKAMKQRIDENRRTGMFWKPKKGKNKIRVLPGIPGKCEEGFFYGTQHVHKVQTEGGFRQFPCLKKMFGKWCPACAAVTLFRDSKKPSLKDAAKELAVKPQFLINVASGPDADIQLWQPSSARMDDLIEILEDEDWGDFTHPKRGFCIIVRGKGDGFGRRYTISAARKSTFRLPEGWKENAYDLTEGPQKLKAREIRHILEEKFEDVYDDLSSELLRLRKKSKKKGAE